MAKIFNIYGSCIPGLHYMVDLKSRLVKGYMLSFNFNREKEIGVKGIRPGDKVLIEAVV